jgi:hypothetical protein
MKLLHPITLTLLATASCLSSALLKGMEQQQGPMDSEWFYDTKHCLADANQLHQEQKWNLAAKNYRSTLATIKFIHKANAIYETDRETDWTTYHKARLNLAACLMALGKATTSWSSFDQLLDIANTKRISDKNNIDDTTITKLVLIRTDQIGIGDIFHFLSAAFELKKRMGWNIILSVPNFLKDTLASAATEYNFDLIGAEDTCPVTDYETHLISLLGYLRLTPTEMNPTKVVFTATEQAINALLEQITPLLDQGNTIVIADRGEVNRQTTLIGGKKLPHNPDNHGRHLDSEPFKLLLKNHHNIILMDCSRKNNRIFVDDEYKKRYLTIADEQQPFNTIIALARIMSIKKGIMGFGPDMGQTNVFTRSLDHETQDRMALIIPDAQDHDMRMEGKGSVYKQMISNCWVYKCETPNEQTRVIEQAYNDMLKFQ